MDIIIVDKNEPEKLRQIADEVRDLGFDYWIIGELRMYVAERKTIIDMLGSIRGRSGQGKVRQRFFEQLERLLIVAEELRKENDVEVIPVVIIEGNHFKRYRARFARMTPNQWFGIQARITEMGVGLIRTWSMNETILALKTLDKRSGKEVNEVPDINVHKTLRDTKEEAMHVLMSITGVGMKKAKQLLQRFGSVIAVLNANENDLAQVVGKKLAKHIKKVVEYNFAGGRLL